jgi:uncharacterized protein YrrD
MEDLGAPMSYLTLEPGTPVLSREGTKVGKVTRVLAEGAADIFDGIVIERGLLPIGAERFVAAEKIRQIYERGVVLDLTESEVEHLPQRAES